MVVKSPKCKHTFTNVILISLTLVLTLTLTSGQHWSAENVTQLIRHLESVDIHVKICPVKNSSTILQLAVQFFLLTIVDFEMVSV
jgi:hypothetical protein